MTLGADSGSEPLRLKFEELASFKSDPESAGSLFAGMKAEALQIALLRHFPKPGLLVQNQ